MLPDNKDVIANKTSANSSLQVSEEKQRLIKQEAPKGQNTMPGATAAHTA